MSKTQKLVLVKQLVGNASVNVGLKTVPDFFEGSVEKYCLELANQLVTNPSFVTFRPVNQGKVYTVVSLNNGNVTFKPFTDEAGLNESEWSEAYMKAN